HGLGGHTAHGVERAGTRARNIGSRVRGMRFETSKEISKSQQYCSPHLLKMLLQVKQRPLLQTGSCDAFGTVPREYCAGAMSLWLALAQFAPSLSYCYFHHENHTFSLSCRSG